MQASGKPPNIVVVAIDSLRPDHLGCYGYSRATSPAIDALAAESVVFEQAFAAGIPTMPSFTTLYTGLHPYRHRIVAHIGHRRLAEHLRTLPQLAQAGGYVTAACDNLVIQGEGLGTWFGRGYDHYSGFLYRPFGDQSTHLTDRALGFFREYADRPLFLFVHYWDPHSPYGPLPPYDTMHYIPGSAPVDMADVRRIHPEYYDAFVGAMRLRHPDDYAYIVAQYDGEISQVDAQVGRLIAGIQDQGAWDNTIFVLLSDHGECFGEGDFYFDHHGLYDAVTHVALLMRVPGKAPRRADVLVSTEDVLPTLMDLAGLPRPQYVLTGTSLLPVVDGVKDEVRPYVVSAESSRQASLALRTTNWKLILPIVTDAHERMMPDFYGRPRSDEILVFDLRADPEERWNVQAELPTRRDELLAMLHEWRDAMLSGGSADPIRTHGLSMPYARFMARLLAQR
ncbi:MAG TPA: sulfatase [Herpetosiphonaceae bacterium]|nr:sulfatase [Herpetosiphonaceae bacterium]